MSRTELPHSIKKFLRREKARMRQEILDSHEAEKKIKELVDKTFGKYQKGEIAIPKQTVYI